MIRISWPWAGLANEHTFMFFRVSFVSLIIHAPSSRYSLLSSLAPNMRVMASTRRTRLQPAMGWRKEDTLYKAHFALSVADQWNTEDSHFNYQYLEDEPVDGEVMELSNEWNLWVSLYCYIHSLIRILARCVFQSSQGLARLALSQVGQPTDGDENIPLAVSSIKHVWAACVARKAKLLAAPAKNPTQDAPSTTWYHYLFTFCW